MDPASVVPTHCELTRSCGITSGPRTDLCSIIDGSTVGNFNSENGYYSFQSVDIDNYPIGDYHFRITITSGLTVEFFDFNLRLTDPCGTAILTLNVGGTEFPDMTYYLRGLRIKYTWPSPSSFTTPTFSSSN